MLLLDSRERLRPGQQVPVAGNRRHARSRLLRLAVLPVGDLRLEVGELPLVNGPVLAELGSGDVRLRGVVAAPVPAAGAVRVRAGRLVVLAARQTRELADAGLERGLVALDRDDLRRRLLDLRLVEGERGRARLPLLEGARLRQLVRDRRLE